MSKNVPCILPLDDISLEPTRLSDSLYIYACPLWAHCGPHHRAVFLGSIIACLSRLLGNMISVASDKGEGVRQELLEKVGWWWGGVRWRQLKLALHVRPAQSIATNLVSQQNYISIQDLNPRSWQQAKGPKIRSNSQECFCSIKVTNLTGVTTVADGRHSKPASTWPPGKPFWTLQPVPLGFLLAIKGLLIAPTLQAKYLKDWLAFSGIGFVQMPACPKVSFLDYTFRAEFLS